MGAKLNVSCQGQLDGLERGIFLAGFVPLTAVTASMGVKDMLQVHYKCSSRLMTLDLSILI